jgi:hypothetical protein
MRFPYIVPGVCCVADYNAVRDEPRIKTLSKCGPIHDKSVRNSSLAPPRLFGLRNGIHLRPLGTLLVRRGNRAAADAGRWQRLPVPGMFEEDGGSAAHLTFSVPRTQRSA